jgi:hypothetical protein
MSVPHDRLAAVNAVEGAIMCVSVKSQYATPMKAVHDTTSRSGLVLLEPSGLAVQNAEWQVGTLLSLSPW